MTEDEQFLRSAYAAPSAPLAIGRPSTEDDQQLKLLSIFYFIVGGLSAVGACIPFIHLGVGIAIVTGNLPRAQIDDPVPASLGWVFIGIASSIIVLGWAYAIGMILTGRRLRHRRSYVLCIVMASMTCLSVPIGTCLGVFTLIVLARPSVKQSFQRKRDPITGLDFI
jgi:hypothetical protein